MNLQVDVSDVTRLSRRLSGAGPVIQRHLVQGVSDAGRIVEGTAKQTAPVVTGEYRRGIASVAGPVAGGAQAIVRASAPHSIYVERGRRGFGPRRARVLVFQVGGRTVYARRVGPAKAQWIMRKALRANEGRIRARLRRAGREAAAAILGGAA